MTPYILLIFGFFTFGFVLGYLVGGVRTAQWIIAHPKDVVEALKEPERK